MNSGQIRFVDCCSLQSVYCFLIDCVDIQLEGGFDDFQYQIVDSIEENSVDVECGGSKLVLFVGEVNVFFEFDVLCIVYVIFVVVVSRGFLFCFLFLNFGFWVVLVVFIC